MNEMSAKILYVDDDPPVLEMIRPSLQLMGHDVFTIDNPLEALKLFRADPYRFDLVITDMSMPEMDGARLATSLLAIRPDLPVIMCTGATDLEPGEAHAIGIKAFLEKPVGRMQMAESIRAALAPSAPS